MLRTLATTIVLFACQRAPEVQAAGEAEVRAAGDGAALELEPLFAAADRDPDAAVELILEASRRIVAIDAGAGHALADRLEPYCRALFFGPGRPRDMHRLGLVTCTVEHGELPGTIARRLKMGPGMFALLNEGYDERRVALGAELKGFDLSDGSLRLVVDRARHRLAAWHRAPDGGPWLLSAYIPVGLGAPETPTPTGTSRIVERVLDPPWTDPNTNVTYAPDDPGNLLGGYWVRLDHAGLGRRGIGLHGFTGEDPSSWLEKDASNGCVRMLQADVDRIFHLALEGTTVQIVP